MTRPDISLSVQSLSQFMQTPMKAHMAAAKNVLRYLKSNLGLRILLSSRHSTTLRCFCDSDWAACHTTRRSVSGYLLKIGDSLISWKVKKQEIVSKSSDEAKYRALSVAILEVIWVLGVMKDLGFQNVDLVKVYCDSKAAIHIANNPIFHERTKHIEVDCHFVREKLQQKIISLHHVCSAEQEADVLTKPLGKKLHDSLNLRGSVEDM
ncbi:secreted RxLR effector protein 161-like [Prosopis cineraria]|uniref:secreted RxLR effector protein 161-like n=1 Tax=Prosopis cineraria TaxID=364024 RepID=UPI00240ECE9F|nr:secreted RxLR effector protein 161-like [Prosopis cineraria]